MRMYCSLPRINLRSTKLISRHRDAAAIDFWRGRHDPEGKLIPLNVIKSYDVCKVIIRDTIWLVPLRLLLFLLLLFFKPFLRIYVLLTFLPFSLFSFLSSSITLFLLLGGVGTSTIHVSMKLPFAFFVVQERILLSTFFILALLSLPLALAVSPLSLS